MICRVLVAVFCCCLAASAVGRELSSPRRLANGFETAAAAAAAAAPAKNATGNDDAMTVFRLPADVVPESYELRVAAHLENLTFSGSVEIAVRAVAAHGCRITLNAKDLQVTAVRVTDRASGKPLTVVEHRMSVGDEQLTVALNETDRCLIPTRAYAVQVDFEAPLRDDMSGFYKSSYREDNVTKWLAVTKFEPTHARKAFPCFDEPALKAPFTVFIKRRSHQISLSNMPLVKSTKIPNTDMFWDQFETTPPISTYLVAFFVGEFYAMKTRNIGIYTHRNYVNQAGYVANKSPLLLEAMENFTGVDYALPKLDLLAIPDFSAGAMENWGLNTYRERLLLLTENSKTKTKEFVTTVVQHELSHQWFGDLVTCAWWDYLWLNEGFATFFEYFATKTVEPEWRLEEVFVYEVHQVALEYDQTPTHAISASVNAPSEIRGMFDDISYSKAGAVLRMLQYTVTEKHFKMALNYYLTNNEYKAATPEELWVAFENVLFDAKFDLDENVTVREFMKSWTEQVGYPLVTVTRVNGSFVIAQERFSVLSSNGTNATTTTTTTTTTTNWVVGLTYATKHNADFDAVLPELWLKENSTVLPSQNETGWYIFNLQSIGFYRVTYDENNWEALVQQLYDDCKAIHVLNRAQMIDDSFNLARAKKLDYPFVLRLTRYLEKEDDVVPWYSAKSGFTSVLERMRRCTHGHADLKTYISYLAGLIYKKTERLILNHNSTEHSVMTGWNAFSNWACKLDNEHCISTASSYFETWRQGKTIPADIKDAAFCVGVKNGDSNVWKRILDVYVNSESASERQSAQSALACSQDPVQLSKYLDFMFEGDRGPILPQDFRVIYNTLASSPPGISALIEFLTNKSARIVGEITNGEQIATSIYSLLASKVALANETRKIDSLRYDLSVPEHLRRRFNSSYHQVDDNSAWFQTNHKRIGQWAKATVNELGLIAETSTTSGSGDYTTVAAETSSTDTPPASSGFSLGDRSRFASIIQLTLSALLVNVFFTN